MNQISVISFISYDYEYLLESIPTYLPYVDEVILGLDRDRTTWAGNKFELPGKFFDDLALLNRDNKIKIVEEAFFVWGTTPLDMLTSERNVLSTHAGAGNWLLSIDADELLLDVELLTLFLREYDDESVLIFANWLTLFKQVDDRLLVIANDPENVEHFPLATKKTNAFTINRHTNQTVAFCPFVAIHKSWARTKKQLHEKLVNRGGFSIEDFEEKWDQLDLSNFENWKDFHPLEPKMWQRLDMVHVDDLKRFAQQLGHEFALNLAQKSISLRARIALLEGKITGRDEILAKTKDEHKKELAEIANAYEKKIAEQLRGYKDLKLRLDAELLASNARRQNEATDSAKK